MLQEEQLQTVLLSAICIVAYSPCSQDLIVDYTSATLQEEQSLAALLSPSGNAGHGGHGVWHRLAPLLHHDRREPVL